MKSHVMGDVCFG